MSDRLLRTLTSRRARRTALLATLWTVIAVCLFAIREVLLPFFLAAFLAYVIDPVVRRISQVRLHGRSPPRWLSVISLYLLLFAVSWAFVVFFVPRLYTEMVKLASTTGTAIQRVDPDAVRNAADRLNAFLERARLPVRVSAEGAEPAALLAPSPVAEQTPATRALSVADAGIEEASVDGTGDLAAPAVGLGRAPALAVEALPRPRGDGPSLRGLPPKAPLARRLLDDAEEETQHVLYTVPLGELARAAGKGGLEALQERTGSIAVQLQQLVGGALNFVFKFFLVLMLTAFLAADIERVKRFCFSVVPIEDRARFDELLSRIDTGLSGVVRGQITICLVNGALTLVGLQLFDVKFAFILATVAAIFSLVPIFGSIASTLPIVAVALATSGVGTALLTLIWIVGIHALEANLLNPKIMGDAARIHPFLVVLALIAGEHSYDIAGALFAVPILSIGLTIFRYVHAQALALEGGLFEWPREPAPRAPGRTRQFWREPRA